MEGRENIMNAKPQTIDVPLTDADFTWLEAGFNNTERYFIDHILYAGKPTEEEFKVRAAKLDELRAFRKRITLAKKRLAKKQAAANLKAEAKAEKAAAAAAKAAEVRS